MSRRKSQGLGSLVFRQWTATWWQWVATVIMCAAMVGFRMLGEDFSPVLLAFYSLLALNVGLAVHVPYGTIKAFGYRRTDFIRINLPVVLLTVALPITFTVGIVPWPWIVALVLFIGGFLMLALYQQIREDRSRNHEPVVEKNPGGGQWHMMLFVVALFGIFLWGWKALRPEIAPDLWGSLVVAVPVIAGAVGSNLMTGTQLAEWQAFGKTRRTWRNRALVNGGIGMLGVALCTLVLEPALVGINVGTFWFTYALMNTTVGAIIAVIVPMTFGGFIRGIEPGAVYLLLSGGVLLLIAAVMLWLYPKYANTQKRLELRR
ncbi:hypothetical protein [Corynebacterium phoceense]|uniref:hypothetical protein n=1 Tax=Corynebacterium phoceense TaxID=1686286 RepID=UPI00211C01CB|nr:hypothetical protein [Corynebacterium phoceense]